MKDCPFCGAKPIRLEFLPVNEDPPSGAVHCMSCDAWGPLAEGDDEGLAADEAERLWNGRYQ